MSQPLIIKSEEILGGIPVFYGTRVPVRNLTDYLAAGDTIEDFLEDFPTVSREQVLQFLQQDTLTPSPFPQGKGNTKKQFIVHLFLK